MDLLWIVNLFLRELTLFLTSIVKISSIPDQKKIEISSKLDGFLPNHLDRFEISFFFFFSFFSYENEQKKKQRKNILRLKHVVLPIIVDSSEASHRVKSMSRARPYFQSIPRFSWSLRFNYINHRSTLTEGKMCLPRRNGHQFCTVQFVNFFACLLYAHETTKQKFLPRLLYLSSLRNQFRSIRFRHLSRSIFPQIIGSLLLVYLARSLFAPRLEF